MTTAVRPDGGTLPAATIVFSGDNSYAGTTTITGAGTTLLVNGTTSGQGSYVVGSGSTLGGGVGTAAGSIGVTAGSQVLVQTGAILAPGNGPGILNITGAGTVNAGGTLQLAGGSTYSVDVAGPTAGSQYDRTNVAGTVTLAASNLTVNLTYVPQAGDRYSLSSTTCLTPSPARSRRSTA